MRKALLGAATAWSTALALSCAAVPAAAQPGGGPGQDKVLRVCQDPNNMPFSNRQSAGFENKIAELFARELGWKLEYTWFPQRMGFIRNTLRAKADEPGRFKCDLVMGVPKGFDMAATTRPYYHSTYAVAYVKGRGLDSVRGIDDLMALDAAQRRKLRLGVFTGSPVTDWLLQNNLMEQVEWYQSQTGDADQYSGQIIERDLASGKIDVAFVWGPIAGYFAKATKAAPVVAVPLQSRAGMKLDFEIAMAVRYGDKDFRQRIDQLIDANRAGINAILEQYGVPMLDQQGRPVQAAERRGAP